MVTLFSNLDGQIYASCQLQDYVLRGPEMVNCSLLSFAIDTWEETYQYEKDKEMHRSTIPKSGRPAHVRAHYMQEHPRWRSHRRVFRAEGHNMLPRIAGPWFPRNDNPSVYDFYCACMLALLKPWRIKEDLKMDELSWPRTFETFKVNASVYDKRIIASIQYYYDSKSACGSLKTDEVEAKLGAYCNHAIPLDREELDSTTTATNEPSIPLTEQDLLQFRRDQVSPREEAHADAAIQIGLKHGIFAVKHFVPCTSTLSFRSATAKDEVKLLNWITTMRLMTGQDHTSVDARNETTADNQSNIALLSQTLFENDAGDTCLIAELAAEAPTLQPVAPNDLLEDQRRAYDIVDWHLQQFISGRRPKPLRMVIPGEAGVGKSKTIQTITANFVARGVSDMLVKAAYTGLAASVIDGKTLHHIAKLPLQGEKQSAQTIQALEIFWRNKHYLIVDEISMVSREMFAKLSSIISRAKTSETCASDEPFGGVNVILVGDFHQFPPVATKPSAALYWCCNPMKDKDKELLGRKLYEQFEVVIRLQTQVRVTDPEWLDLLQHVRYGNCDEKHMNMLRKLTLTHETCPATDFTTLPWKDAVLVTPRHAVRMKWNSWIAKVRTQSDGMTLINCPAFDTIQGRRLTLEEKFAVATKAKTGRGRNRREHGGLADEVDIAVGMEVMVTFNVSTDLDVANGARGHVVEIVVDAREEMSRSTLQVQELKYPPCYILVRMFRTKANALDGLECGVLPITPLTKTFSVVTASGEKVTVTRQQLPITPAYAFTDYRSQAQTIDHCIVDLATPPSGQLTPFNAYVALSRSRGRNSIRLLRDFDERLFTHHPSEHLHNEDERLKDLDRKTTKEWIEFTSNMM